MSRKGLVAFSVSAGVLAILAGVITLRWLALSVIEPILKMSLIFLMA